MYCSVCLKKNSVKLHTCVKCKISVHISCYGINETVKNSEYLCDFCIAAANEELTRACELCPNANRALKQTVAKTWIHAVCTL